MSILVKTKKKARLGIPEHNPTMGLEDLRKHAMTYYMSVCDEACEWHQYVMACVTQFVPLRFRQLEDLDQAQLIEVLKETIGRQGDDKREMQIRIEELEDQVKRMNKAFHSYLNNE